MTRVRAMPPLTGPVFFVFAESSPFHPSAFPLRAEIAFYKGNTKEKQVLEGVFDKLVSVTRRSERFRHSLGALDSVVAKYFATLVGWTVVSRPFINKEHPRHANSTAAEVYQGSCVLLNTW